MNEKLKNRLENWKFKDAQKFLGGEPDPVADIVDALANNFGNSGWLEGDMGLIIQAAIDSLIGEAVDDGE